MKKVDSYAYFLNDFMQKNSLFPASGHLYIGLSGGIDSIVLFHLLLQLRGWAKIKKLTCLHVNHGTRVECDREEEFVRNLCMKHDVEIKVCHLNLNKLGKISNFEKKARQMRQDFFFQFLGLHDYVATGHHLNDSFEWHLMKKFSSSRSVLGIACRSSKVVRPLLCLTKDQIKAYAKKEKLQWFEDSSNDDLSYERNYIRHKVVAPLLRKYPKAIKHYVEWAQSQVVNESAQEFEKEYFHAKYSFFLFSKKELSGRDLERLKFHVKRLSTKERGQIHEQIQKINMMIAHGKKGPLHFSGGVHLFILSGMLVFLKSSESYKLVYSTQIPERSFPLFKEANNKNNRLKEHPLLTLLKVDNNNHFESYARAYFAKHKNKTDGKNLFFFLK